MSSTQRPAVQRCRRALALLVVVQACCSASASVSQPRPQGFGLGDYEYYYDELPREHLRRSARAAAEQEAKQEAVQEDRQALEAYQEAAEALKQETHVQHVPADAPRAREAADADSAIQRVPRVEAAATVRPAAAAPVPAPAAQQAQAPVPAAPQPPARLRVPAEDAATSQAPEGVPTAVPDAKLAKDSKEPKEDMETANFFWGLGPVYPHLYVYRRVPHLVPLHGWSPYHAYYITHPNY